MRNLTFKRRLWRGVYEKLDRLQAKINDYLEEHDTCELCTGEDKEVACRRCVVCNARVCSEHESGYYSDAEFCMQCRAEITPAQERQDYLESVAATCESGCHHRGCLCTRAHDQHTEECGKCRCFATDEPCDKQCAPSGYTGQGHDEIES